MDECKPLAPNPTCKLRFCGGCNAAKYCGATCQRLDWAAHKVTCKQEAERRNDTAACEAGRCGLHSLQRAVAAAAAVAVVARPKFF